MFQSLQKLYKQRNYKIYVMNAPWSISTVYNILKPFIDKSVQEKVTIVSKSVYEPMFMHINKN